MNLTTTSHDARKHILDMARPLFARRGFTSVGLAELLTAAQVPKGSFYHYFRSKEAFGEAVLDAYFADYLAGMDRLLAEPGTAADRLMAYFRDWLDSQTDQEAQGRCLAVKLGAEVCDLSEDMRRALARGTGGVTRRLERCLDEGLADGSLPARAGAPDTRTVALTLYQNWLGAGLLAKIAGDRTPLDVAMDDTRRRLGLAP